MYEWNDKLNSPNASAPAQSRAKLSIPSRLMILGILLILGIPGTSQASKFPQSFEPNFGLSLESSTVSFGLSLESSAQEIEHFRNIALEINGSQWSELALLGELALSAADSLEAGDLEDFVGMNAVLQYRTENFSENLKIELLRILIGATYETDQAIQKCDGGGGNQGCTSHMQCFLECGPPLGGSCDFASGTCICD